MRPQRAAVLLKPLLLAGFAAVVLAPLAGADQAGIDGPFIESSAITWKVNSANASRWKTLVGGSEGGQINASDVQFGEWQLAPGAIYHGHRHEAPEIYYITGGKARWTVGDESREVTAGTTVYTRPGEVHRMENLTDEPVTALWIWWAPGGDTSVFSGEYTFTEPQPAQPGVGFEESVERIY